MPQVNLSDVTGQELRRLLDASRRRGDAALSYKLLQEMAARRDAPAARRGAKARRDAEPRHIEVELGDPADNDDDLPPIPTWRPPAGSHLGAAPPASAAPEPEPSPRTLDDDRPLSLWDPADAPSAQASKAAPPPGPRNAYRPRLRLVLGLAIGLAAGLALGVWIGQMPRDAPPAATPAAAPLQAAALSPPPAPVAETPPPPAADTTADAQPEAAAQTPPDSLEPAHAAPPPPASAARAEAEPAKSAETAEPTPERATTSTAAVGCGSAPTPADRTICGDARLRRLQDELRRAYGDALDAHEDRALLRARQLAWRDARSAVTDPDRLAQLYEERVRKLKAATAAALAAK